MDFVSVRSKNQLDHTSATTAESSDIFRVQAPKYAPTTMRTFPYGSNLFFLRNGYDHRRTPPLKFI